MSVNQELQETAAKVYGQAPPEVAGPVNASRAEIEATFDRTKVPQPGDTLPDFALVAAGGKTVTRDELLAESAILITFYRGNWCPFCNIALRGLQKHLSEFTAKGVRLVAISAELPDHSLSTKEKNELDFEVLSDVDNKYADKLGVLWKMPSNLKDLFGGFGTLLEVRHGNDRFEVPVPISLLVDKKGIVRNTFVEPDYTKRLEPSTAVEWVNAL